MEIREQVEELEKWAKQAQKFQQIFGSNLTRYQALDDLVSDISLKKGMWQVLPSLPFPTHAHTQPRDSDDSESAFAHAAGLSRTTRHFRILLFRSAAPPSSTWPVSCPSEHNL